jgi:carbamoyltransferase
MGLASYATEYQMRKPYKIFKETLQNDGIDFSYAIKPHDNYYWFKERLEGCRFDGIAGALQKYVEEVMSNWVKAAMTKFNCDTLVMSGGLALNIKINKVISELPEVKKFFVAGGGGDESQSIGAALYVAMKYTNNTIEPPLHDYHGPHIDIVNFEKEIASFNIKENFFIKENATIKEMAELLANDQIVARCTGRSEFGPRALGNRSILANPSNPQNVRKINNQIKYRDFWMPFTPSILRERAEDYIINPKNLEAPFMTIAFESTDLARKELIGGLHPSDFTVRPQFVTAEKNQEYYDLIKNFERLTGIGGLLNTSLNLHGEPIVGTVKDALHTLVESDLDAMIIENKLLVRKK